MSVGQLLMFIFEAEAGIRNFGLSRGLEDVYKRRDQIVLGQAFENRQHRPGPGHAGRIRDGGGRLDDPDVLGRPALTCPIYTPDAADDLLVVQLLGSRLP